MNDHNIMEGLRVRHERFVEEPTVQKARHIKMFIYGYHNLKGDWMKGSFYDMSPMPLLGAERYYNAVHTSMTASFNPTSLTHLQTVADEVFGETA